MCNISHSIYNNIVVFIIGGIARLGSPGRSTKQSINATRHCSFLDFAQYSYTTAAVATIEKINVNGPMQSIPLPSREIVSFVFCSHHNSAFFFTKCDKVAFDRTCRSSKRRRTHSSWLATLSPNYRVVRNAHCVHWFFFFFFFFFFFCGARVATTKHRKSTVSRSIRL
jgi:hypothetical protein